MTASFFIALLFFVVGLILRPALSRSIKSMTAKIKRYEITFKIEFYSQPSIHHLGEEGVLVKTDSIKLQIDAEGEDEALTMLDGIIKQEIKAELLAMKEIPRIPQSVTPL
jgi:hypothetical protein